MMPARIGGTACFCRRSRVEMTQTTTGSECKGVVAVTVYLNFKLSP
jgi:hypothetical protein